MKKTRLFSLLTGLLLCLSGLSAKDYKASQFGIKSDGVTLNTRSIQRAVDYISEQGGGRLVFYVGRYLTGSIELKSNVTIQIEEGAALLGVASIYDYTGITDRKALIYATDQQNIGITGKGLIEGRSPIVLNSIQEQLAKKHIEGSVSFWSPSLILINNCNQILLDEITLLNSCNTAIVLDNSKAVKLTNLTIKNTLSESAALSLLHCNGVDITDCYLDTKTNPVISAGNSSGLLFNHCIKPDGGLIQFEK